MTPSIRPGQESRETAAGGLRDEWLCGYAAALASIVRLQDLRSVAKSTATADGLTLERFRRAGVEEFDMRELRKAWR